MLNKSRLFFVLLLTGLLVSGCRKETLEGPPSSLNYFPVNPGHWVEYRSDSVFHAENDNQNDDSVYYFISYIREEIDSTFTDGSGRSVQVLKRYFRRDLGEDWVLDKVWTQYLLPAGAYRVEDNITYHKLAFPINEDMAWNGNDANAYEEEIYRYEYFHEPGSFNQVSFDSTLSVLQMDEDNYIERLYASEMYATGVGLVYKEKDNLGKINGIVVSGYETRLTVTAYGQER